MAYYVGDVPAEDLVIYPMRQALPVDLTPFDEGTATLTTYDGTLIETSGFLVSIDHGEGAVVVEWPGESVFASAGVYQVNVTLSSTTTAVQERVAPAFVVVHEDDGWHTVDTLRSAVKSDFDPDDMNAWTLLECAKLSVAAFGPTIGFQADGVTPADSLGNFYAGLPILGYKSDGTTPVRPPIHFKQGELMQAENILNISKTDPSTTDDAGNFVIRPYPLDNAIKQLLRPKQGPLAFV